MLTAFGPAGDLTLRDGATSKERHRAWRGGLKPQQKCAWIVSQLWEYLANSECNC